MCPASLLVVDDDPDNFDVIDTLLADQGYELYYADNGQYAIDHLETFQPDLLLLDVMMPGLNGVGVCRLVRSLPRWQALPIIMVTALDSKLSLSTCLEAGADDFITKPLNGLELKARIQAMLRLKYQYEALQNLLQQRESMVQMIVHDLRNPLTSLILGLQILQTGKCNPQTIDQKLVRLMHSGQQIQHLVDDMLVMAKQEQGKICLDYQDVDLVPFIAGVLEDCKAIADQKNITLEKQCDANNIPLQVDPLIFGRILSNLLSNAVKFSPEGSTIRVVARRGDKDNVQISVEDQGPGIQDEIKSKIFEPYEVGTMMPNIAQIGLGLAFCKMMSEAHGGTIAVKDNQPRGAILLVTVPQHPVVGKGWRSLRQWSLN